MSEDLRPEETNTAVEPATYLIVNADDFGYSRGVNDGILEAHERGIVTSASLMVDQNAAADAAVAAGRHPELSVGLHVELRRWRVRKLPWRRQARAEERLRESVAVEVRRQLDSFRTLVGADPTHLDSHQHRHRQEPARSIMIELAQELGVPLRQFDSRISFLGYFYGQVGAGKPNPAGIRPEALVSLLEALPSGVTELCSHPGFADDLDDWYREERAHEVRTLCDARVREAIERIGIRLTSFREVSAWDDGI